jgi:hypothetical protein
MIPKRIRLFANRPYLDETLTKRLQYNKHATCAAMIQNHPMIDATCLWDGSLAQSLGIKLILLQQTQGTHVHVPRARALVNVSNTKD